MRKSIKIWFILNSLLLINAKANVPDSLALFIGQELEGFARSNSLSLNFMVLTTGGVDGTVYRVNTLDDEENCKTKTKWTSGSLRCAAESDKPFWIVFDTSGIIGLKEPLLISSNKTIDGRNRNITISQNTTFIGSCLENDCKEGLYHTNNVILTNLTFEQKNEKESTKGIKIQGAKNVWIHHCTFNKWEDGMVYVRNNATNITLSWNRFEIPGKPRSKKGHYHRAVLVGIGTGEKTRISIHHNYFKNILNRAPKVDRKAFAHLYNNLIEGTVQHSVSARDNAKIVLENNIFNKSMKKNLYVVCEQKDHKKGKLKISGNLFDITEKEFWFQNNPGLCDDENIPNPKTLYKYHLSEADRQLEEQLKKECGAK